jgi:HK97 family phage portal protein
MTVVQTLTGLVDYSPAWNTSSSYGSLQLYDQFSYSYQVLYKTQPNVRTCVDFLARNIAQLGLHVFRRVSETDRQRLRDHPLATLLSYPNEYTTRYRLIESLMGDLGVFFAAYWLKIDNGRAKAILRIPPELVNVHGYLFPTQYDVSLPGKTYYLPPDQIVHFGGYNPIAGTVGLSPLETLRRVLAEEHAMGDYREYFWRNAARQNGVIERPAEAPEWSETARTRFKAEFESLYSGATNSGKTAILEEGMSWKPTAFSAQESEYLLGRKLTREECARAYHIPLPMVGILDHATFSNISEQHRNLYQDSLGPWLTMISEEIELQLLSWVGDQEGVYVEFNIAEKMAGSFLEQAQSFSTLVGRPIMAANEGRARLNLPRAPQEDADRLVTVGGQASPRDSAPPKAIALKAATVGDDGSIDPTLPETRARHVEKWAEVLRVFFERQGIAMLKRTQPGATIDSVWTDGGRWSAELGDDFLKLSAATALVFARYIADQLGAELDEARMATYLATASRISAEEINLATRDRLAAALLAEIPRDAVKGLFAEASTTGAQRTATSKVTQMANFGAHEGASQGGLRWKIWQENSGNPREAHVAMAGEKVRIGDLFSNGMRWPGSPEGGAANNAHCGCSMRFSRDE